MDPLHMFPLYKGQARVFLGCGNNKSNIVLSVLKGKSNEWDEYGIHKIAMNTDTISGIEVGPNTVVQTFRDPNFHTMVNTLKNESAGPRHFDFGCVLGHNKWKSMVRAIKVWHFDEWLRVYGVIQCNKDSDCYDYQLCLCKTGERHPSWCPNEKRRCMHRSKLKHEKAKKIRESDLVDMFCVADYMNRRPFIRSFANIKKVANLCSGHEILEPFGEVDYSFEWWKLAVLVLVILLLYYGSCGTCIKN